MQQISVDLFSQKGEAKQNFEKKIGIFWFDYRLRTNNRFKLYA